MAKGSKVPVKVSDSPLVEEITDEDNLTSMISKASITFEGHPADVTEDDKEGGPEKKEKDATELPAKKNPPEAKPPDKNPPEEGKDKTDLEAASDKTVEEVENLKKRLSDTQRDFHSTREESKKIREENAKLSSQLQDLLVAMNKQRVETPAPAKKDPMEGLGEAMEKTLDEIEGLDPTSSDYRAKTVQSWNKVFGKFKDILEQTVDSRLTATKSELERDREEQRKKDREEREENERTSKIHDYAGDKATEAGLDMKTNIEIVGEDGKKSKTNSTDYDLFWRFAGYAQGDTTDDKIEWTIKEVKRIKGDVATPIVRAKEKAIKTQQNNSVLEKGGSKPPESNVPEKTMTLDEAIGKAQRQF